MKQRTYFDLHTHAVDANSVPLDSIIGRYGSVLQLLMRRIPFIKADDTAKKVLNYLQLGTRKILINTQDTVLRAAKAHGFDKCVIASLSIDFSTINKQFGQHNYFLGLEKTIKEATIDGCTILPFYGVNPNSKESIDSACFLFNTNRIAGIKIYPPLCTALNGRIGLNYLIYKASRLSIPIITHCSDGGFMPARESKKDARIKSDPSNYRKYINQYQDVRLCFAHVGGDGSKFTRQILEYCANYKNIYTDISYICYDRKLLGKVLDMAAGEKVLNKIIFGTDFFVSMLEGRKYEDAITNTKGIVGDATFNSFTSVNPQNFLGVVYHE